MYHPTSLGGRGKGGQKERETRSCIKEKEIEKEEKYRKRELSELAKEKGLKTTGEPAKERKTHTEPNERANERTNERTCVY